MTSPEKPTQTLRISIRAKLLLYAAAVLIIPTLVYGVLVFRTARAALEPSLREQLAGDAATVKAALEQLLAGHVQNVRTWARLHIMRELVVHDIDKTVSRFLEGVKRDYGVYLDVLAMDNDGICRASSAPGQIGQRFPGFSELVEDTGEQHGIFAPVVAYSKEHRSLYIRLAARIPDPDQPDRTLGTLVALLERSVLQKVVHPKAGHGRSALRLLDARGRVLAGPDGDEQPWRLPLWQVHRTEDARYVRGGPPVVYRAVRQDGLELIVSETGLDPSRALPQLKWRVVAAIPTGLALSPVTYVRNRVLLFGSVVTLAGLALAWLLSSNISTPIKNLTQITSQIAERGVFESIPDPGSNDEVGELTRSFQVMARNISAAHEELVQSAKLAFLGEMAAGIAHEIRTPLGIIKNSAQLLERRMAKSRDREGVEFSRFIYEETDRLNAVVTELLNFARPAPPDKALLDLNGIVQRAVHFLRSEASTKRVVLEAQLDPDLPQLVCDGSQMYQVFLNLLLNAIQACEGGGVVEISTQKSRGRVDIMVRDTGHGIPAEVQTNLFEPFSTKREGGIGLGLAIVKRIVTAHSGGIAASNRSGPGAEFRVWIPTAETREDGSQT